MRSWESASEEKKDTDIKYIRCELKMKGEIRVGNRRSGRGLNVVKMYN